MRALLRHIAMVAVVMSCAVATALAETGSYSPDELVGAGHHHGGRLLPVTVCGASSGEPHIWRLGDHHVTRRLYESTRSRTAGSGHPLCIKRGRPKK